MNDRAVFFIVVFVAMVPDVFSQGSFAILPHGSNRCCAVSAEQEMLGDSLSACRGNVVDYSVAGDSVGSFSYTWHVEGGDVLSYTSDSTAVSILWGDGDEGHIHLTRLRGRRSHTVSVSVRLIEKPAVASGTVPDYTVLADGAKVLSVCMGDRVSFVDRSTAGETQVADYYWVCNGTVSNSRVFEFTPNAEGNHTVVHRVYNRCGCYDEEEIRVEASAQCPFEMGCYGTACGGGMATYTLMSPDCSGYTWSVENGMIVEGQGSTKLTVKWGNPPSGYGVIMLDGSSCDCECKFRKSIRVPIISDGVKIEGPDTVCVGTASLFSLPLYGSTGYTWTVEPAATAMVSGGLPNERYVTFLSLGTYTVKADYTCPFLGCVGTSGELTVEVLDSLRALPRSAMVCQGEAFSCTTDSHGPVGWTVVHDGTAVYDTVWETLSFRPAAAGGYRVLATSGRHCNTAECVLTVRGRPVAPSSLGYPSVACPNSDVLLAGRASDGCYLEWRSRWGGTIPSVVSGDTVSVRFGDTLSTMLACQVDCGTGCRSDSAVLDIGLFSLAPFDLDTLKICQGQRRPVSVPDQSADGVLYNWWVEHPEMAAIEGDNRVSSISVIANYTEDQIPYRTRLFLRRKSCLGETVRTVILLIGQTTAPTIYSSPYACQNEAATFRMDTEHETGALSSECVWSGGGNCHRAEYRDTVRVLPRLGFSYDCVDSLTIADSSVYSQMFLGNRDIYVYNRAGDMLAHRLMPDYGQTRTVKVSTSRMGDGDTLTVRMVRYGCEYTVTYVFHTPPHNVSIDARGSMCSQTPFLFSGSAEGTGLTYRWDFGDGSYNFGQEMWHVFDTNITNNRNTNIILLVTDYQGCSGHAIFSVQRKNNPFEAVGSESYSIRNFNTIYPVCVGDSVKLVYNTDADPHRPEQDTRYVWMPRGDTTFGDSSYAVRTGQHFVFATDTVYQCRGEEMTGIGFHNTPTSKIMHKGVYCEGETANLTGNVGAQYDYEWRVWTPSQALRSYSTPNISFEADETGMWSVALTVTAPQGEGGCSSTSTSSFEVTQAPPPPVIDFDGNECITEGPVRLASVDGIDLVWRNGAYGPGAVYYYDGPVSAYRVDPVTGCKSPSSQMTIAVAPRFDALLTGCYNICEGETPQIEVQSLGAGVSSWTWNEGGQVADQGSSFPASLSVSPTNTYTMVAEYGNSCEATSPGLEINGVDCSNELWPLVDIEFDGFKMELEECSIKGGFSFHVHNRGEVLSQSYSPLLNSMEGQLLFDYGKFSQLYRADSCVHLHLLVCDKDNSLCIADTCLDVDRLFEGVPALGCQPRQKSTGMPEGKDIGAVYALMPNPATGWVTVIDAAGRHVAADIGKVEVYTLDGRLEFAVVGKATFDAGVLPKAAYIVKITSKEDRTEHLKLIKYRNHGEDIKTNDNRHVVFCGPFLPQEPEAVGDTQEITLEVCPNPTTGTVAIRASAPIIQTETYDTQGRLVERTSTSTIDLSRHPRGVYFLKVQTQQGLAIRRVVRM